MSKSGKIVMNAVTMRWVLFTVLVVLIVGASAGFYAVYQHLNTIAMDISEKQSKADSVDMQLQQLQRLEREMKDHKNSIEKAQNIVAQSQSYQYQDQIINDLSAYAATAGVQIIDFTFQNEAPKTNASTASSATQSAAGAATTDAASVATSSSNTSIKSVHVTIQFAPEVEYMRFMRFMHLIEQNLTRMQLAGVTMARNEKSPDTVSVQPLDLEVYIR